VLDDVRRTGVARKTVATGFVNIKNCGDCNVRDFFGAAVGHSLRCFSVLGHFDSITARFFGVPDGRFHLFCFLFYE